MEEVTTGARHIIPDSIYEQDAFFTERVGLIQSLLDKWDSIMNDTSIPEQDRAFFKAAFYGYMSEIKHTEGMFGPGEQLGFDNLLNAIENGRMDYLGDVLDDSVVMEKLMFAFAECFKKAQESTGVQIGTVEDRLANMFLQNDWDGLNSRNRGRLRT